MSSALALRTPVDPRDVAILARRRLPRHDDGRAHLRVGRIDDLVEAAVRHDRQPVRLEDREERLVRLGDRHLLRREDGGLDVADLAAEDEALARQLADDANELRQVGVLEREGDLVPLGARLVLDAGLELREALRVRRSGAARRRRGRRGRRRRRRAPAGRALREPRERQAPARAGFVTLHLVGALRAAARTRRPPAARDREVAEEQGGEDVRLHEGRCDSRCLLRLRRRRGRRGDPDLPAGGEDRGRPDRRRPRRPAPAIPA